MRKAPPVAEDSGGRRCGSFPSPLASAAAGRDRPHYDASIGIEILLGRRLHGFGRHCHDLRQFVLQLFKIALHDGVSDAVGQFLNAFPAEHGRGNDAALHALEFGGRHGFCRQSLQLGDDRVFRLLTRLAFQQLDLNAEPTRITSRIIAGADIAGDCVFIDEFFIEPCRATAGQDAPGSHSGLRCRRRSSGRH